MNSVMKVNVRVRLRIRFRVRVRVRVREKWTKKKMRKKKIAQMTDFNTKFQISTVINGRLFVKIKKKRFFFYIMKNSSTILVLFKKASLLVSYLFLFIVINLRYRWFSLVKKLAQQISPSTFCPGKKSKWPWSSLQHNHVCCSSF